jgi:hypothetical protein
MLLSHVEHNSEMIHNLSYKIDDLRDLIEKLIKDSPPPLKEYTTTKRLTSDRPFWLTSDGQTARHW